VHPGATAGAVLLAVLTGLAPAVTAWLTKGVLDALTTHPNHDALPALAAGLAACGLCVVVLPHASTYAQAQLRRAVRALVAARLFGAVNAHGGLRRLEDPAFQDTLRLAHESSQNAPDRLIVGALTIGQAAITLAGFVGTLLVINPLLIAVISLAALPSVRVQLRPAPARRAEFGPGRGRRARRLRAAAPPAPGADQRPHLAPARRGPRRRSHRGAG
jgi:ATP-binding cassette subfamily B protein